MDKKTTFGLIAGATLAITLGSYLCDPPKKEKTNAETREHSCIRIDVGGSSVPHKIPGIEGFYEYVPAHCYSNTESFAYTALAQLTGNDEMPGAIKFFQKLDRKEAIPIDEGYKWKGQGVDYSMTRSGQRFTFGIDSLNDSIDIQYQVGLEGNSVWFVSGQRIVSDGVENNGLLYSVRPVDSEGSLRPMLVSTISKYLGDSPVWTPVPNKSYSTTRESISKLGNMGLEKLFEKE